MVRACVDLTNLRDEHRNPNLKDTVVNCIEVFSATNNRVEECRTCIKRVT